MTSRVVNMTLCRSRVPDSRAQRKVTVSEVALDYDRLSSAADRVLKARSSNQMNASTNAGAAPRVFQNRRVDNCQELLGAVVVHEPGALQRL
jgi:hypothetical protein